MQEPLAFLNGRWIPASAAAVSVSDVGFILGATVAEQLRTFAGTIFHLDEHLARLAQSLEIVGLQTGMAREELARTARELVARNHALLPPGDDLALSIFVTPGDYPRYVDVSSNVSPLPLGGGQGVRLGAHTARWRCFFAGSPHPNPLPKGEGTIMNPPSQGEETVARHFETRYESPGPTVCLHTYPLPFHRWAARYREGQALATTEVEQVSLALLAAESEMPQPHALLLGRPTGRGPGSARSGVAAGRARLCDRGLHGQPVDLPGGRRSGVAADQESVARHQPGSRGRTGRAARHPRTASAI